MNWIAFISLLVNATDWRVFSEVICFLVSWIKNIPFSRRYNWPGCTVRTGCSCFYWHSQMSPSSHSRPFILNIMIKYFHNTSNVNNFAWNTGIYEVSCALMIAVWEGKCALYKSNSRMSSVGNIVPQRMSTDYVFEIKNTTCITDSHLMHLNAIFLTIERIPLSRMTVPTSFSQSFKHEYL